MPMSHGSVTGLMSTSASPRISAWRSAHSTASSIDPTRRIVNPAGSSCSPANGPRVNAVGGKAFADFMVSPDAQSAIKSLGLGKYGQALFVPIAGKSEEEIGG